MVQSPPSRPTSEASPIPRSEAMPPALEAIANTGRATLAVGQLGQSLDGRIATLTGASQWINGPGALDHLHGLRSVVDAVIVGAGTAIADDPQLTVRRLAGANPARVVIDPNGRVPATARCFANDGVRRIVVCDRPRDLPDGIECVVVERDMAHRILSPRRIRHALHAIGLNKLLIEGGAATVSAFLDEGALDRLHVLIAPVILGSGVTGLSLSPIASLDEAHRPKADIHVLDDGNVLFDCAFNA